MRQHLLTVMVVVGVAFAVHGGPVAAQDHGAVHGQASLTDQLMSADANEDGKVTPVEIANLLTGNRPGHGGGDHDGAGHHETAEVHGNPHGDHGGDHPDGHGAASLATLLGGHGGTALADMSQADLEARLTMLVGHADTDSDSALNASEAEALIAMMREGGGH